MNEAYSKFENNLNELQEIEQDDLPRSLRLFNIRVRLAIDILVDFKGEVSLTQTKDVRDTYILIIQLMELWNAYEALFHYVGEVTDYVVKKVGKSKVYTQSFLKQVGSLPILEKAVSNIYKIYKRNQIFLKYFDVYIDRIEKDDKLSQTLKTDAESIRKYLDDEKEISGIELLSLIYAERNMYYHNGETAKMGMRYSNRRKLISWYKEALLAQTLKVANAVVLEQIKTSK